MASTRSAAPILPVDISQSPLISSPLLLPSDLFATLAGPLPQITIGPFPPTSPRLGAPGRIDLSRPPRFPNRANANAAPKLSSPTRTHASPTSPSQITSLFDLLETMKHDVASEVQRVRLNIQEARLLVRACREDSAAREAVRLQRMEEERK